MARDATPSERPGGRARGRRRCPPAGPVGGSAVAAASMSSRIEPRPAVPDRPGGTSSPASMRWSSRPSSRARKPRLTASTSIQAGSSPVATPWWSSIWAAPTRRSRRRREHVAHAGLAVGLRPGLEERDLARSTGVLVDRLDVQGDGDGQSLGRRGRRREPGGQLLEALGRRSGRSSGGTVRPCPRSTCRWPRRTGRSPERRRRSWRPG